MSLVRYRPAEAVRWLEMGSGTTARGAHRRGAAVFRSEEPDLKRSVRDAAGAIVGAGKSAIAHALHAHSTTVEYVLHDDYLEIVGGAKTRVVAYRDIQRMVSRGDRVDLELADGSIKIAPPAYISVGRVRVPIGWNRNGIDVPFDLLPDELSARCRVNIESE